MRPGNILEEFIDEMEKKERTGGKTSFDWTKNVDWSSVKIYDLSQPLGVLTPPFPTYPPFTFKWIKVLSEHQVQAQYVEGPLHIGTHLDGPLHFDPAGKDIASVPMEYLVGEGVIIDISDQVGELEIYTPEILERKAKQYNLEIKDGDIIAIYTGFHRYAWYKPEADTIRYQLKHPGPKKEFADWLIRKKIKWTAVDAVSQDHPLNTVIRRVRPDIVEEFERKFKKSVQEVMPWPENYQLMHTYLFPKGILHVENMGGEVEKVLNRRCVIGIFPFKFQGGESAWARMVAFCSD